MLRIFQWRDFSTLKFVEIGDGAFLVSPKNLDTFGVLGKYELSWNLYHKFIRITSRSKVSKGNSNQRMLQYIIFIQLTKKSGVLGFSRVLLRNLRFLFRQAESGEIWKFLLSHHSLCKLITGILVVNLQSVWQICSETIHGCMWNLLLCLIVFAFQCSNVWHLLPLLRFRNQNPHLFGVGTNTTYNFELVSCKRAKRRNMNSSANVGQFRKVIVSTIICWVRKKSNIGTIS